MIIDNTANQLSLSQAGNPFELCPLSIGDTVYITGEAFPEAKTLRLISDVINIVSLSVPQKEYRKAYSEGSVKTITDIVCINHLGGGSEFRYALNNGSVYSPIRVR